MILNRFPVTVKTKKSLTFYFCGNNVIFLQPVEKKYAIKNNEKYMCKKYINNKYNMLKRFLKKYVKKHEKNM
jgi:hypothetical protein